MVRKRGLPKWGELVVCRVKRITPFAAWCELMEYPNVESMIHIAEVAGVHVYDIRDFVKKDKVYVTKVIRIDYQKNSVNLSIKRVSVKEEKRKLRSFKQEQKAEKLLERAAKSLEKNLDEAYEEVGFTLQENFDSLFSAFRKIKKSEKILTKLKISKEWQHALIKIVKEALVERKVKLAAELELKTWVSDGVEKIKDVLRKLKSLGMVVKYISAPIYKVELLTKNPKEDKKKMLAALERSVKKIRKIGTASYKLLK
jgi:translation initiation factor 2 subunit 1